MADTITVIMEGGLIQDIIGIPAGITIRVHDYDVEGVDTEDLKTNGDGEEYTEAIWEAQTGEENGTH